MSNFSKPYDFLAKIHLAGAAGVGKTSILHRYCEACFGCWRHPSTIGIDFKMKTIEVDGKKVKLHTWDNNGSERFRTVVQTYYKGVMGIILCYANDDRESFEKIEFFMEEVRRSINEDACIVLVGTKSDLSDERVVSIDEGRKLAESHGVKFFETSAKENLNIDKVFLTLARDVYQVVGDKKDASEKLQLRKANAKENECGKCF